MAVNNRLDRRHDINKNERLPERHTRVLDEEVYRDNIEAVLKNEADDAFQKALEAKRKADAIALENKKARVIPGAIVVLNWGSKAFCRVDAIQDTGFKVGPFWYGWECVEIPSQELIAMVESEVGAI